jgi:hypothetical protein
MPFWWRRVRQHFGISAPRMAVRTYLPWWGRGVLLVMLLAIIGGMWWWGFDFGQILGGFNRKEIEARLVTLEADAAKLRAEAIALRASNSALESELGMTRGAQEALTRQARELSGENAQLKEELAFLQKVVSDSSQSVGLQIQRIAVEPDGEDMWRYSLLIVRGGSPKEEFNGNVVVQATIATGPDGGTPPRTILLPEDEPTTASALVLKFKYYQRVEGTFRVPSGGQLKSLQARVVEPGQATPKATRSLNLT